MKLAERFAPETGRSNQSDKKPTEILGAIGNAGYWNDVAAKAAVKMAADKVNRIIKECVRTVEDVRMALMISNDKGKDRTAEENALKRVAAQETEVTQALAMLPYSKDMYQYKVNQVNEIADARKALEKVLVENRLANRIGPSKLDPAFNERKKRVRSELRKALGEEDEIVNDYDVKLGFNLHFDFILDIPEPHQASQVSFGIYNKGKVISPTQVTGTHTVDGWESENITSIYGEKHTLVNILADEQTLLFFEVQFLNQLDNVHQNTSYGWTALDVFTAQKTLKRGRFKLPIYAPPADLTATKDRFGRLQPLPRGGLHVRINQ